MVLADEINRASPKVQSALLEAMGERAVTVDGITHRLPEPFFVVATQNPLDHHGTHPLPESQLDRFMVRLRRSATRTPPTRRPCCATIPRRRALPGLDARARARRRARAPARRGRDQVPRRARVATCSRSSRETRDHEAIAVGVSPRGAIALRRAAQARALLDGRDFCIPEDVAELAVDVLAHRIALDARTGTARGAEESACILREILDRTSVPL